LQQRAHCGILAAHSCHTTLCAHIHALQQSRREVLAEQTQACTLVLNKYEGYKTIAASMEREIAAAAAAAATAERLRRRSTATSGEGFLSANNITRGRSSGLTLPRATCSVASDDEGSTASSRRSRGLSRKLWRPPAINTSLISSAIAAAAGAVTTASTTAGATDSTTTTTAAGATAAAAADTGSAARANNGTLSPAFSPQQPQQQQQEQQEQPVTSPTGSLNGSRSGGASPSRILRMPPSRVVPPAPARHQLSIESLARCDKALVGPAAAAARAKAESVLSKELNGAADITGENQLLVEVMSARGLRPTDLQGYSNPYCVIYLKVRRCRLSLYFLS
jgi:hypothetical protein